MSRIADALQMQNADADADAECRMQNAECRIQNPESRALRRGGNAGARFRRIIPGSEMRRAQILSFTAAEASRILLGLGGEF